MTVFSPNITKWILNCWSLTLFCPSSRMVKSKPLISAKQVWQEGNMETLRTQVIEIMFTSANPAVQGPVLQSQMAADIMAVPSLFAGSTLG